MGQQNPVCFMPCLDALFIFCSSSLKTEREFDRPRRVGGGAGPFLSLKMGDLSVSGQDEDIFLGIYKSLRWQR